MKTFTTKDFYLSALLYSKNFKLIDSQINNDNTVYFIFENNNEELLNELLSGFVDRTVKANVKDFVTAQNAMRNVLSKHKK